MGIDMKGLPDVECQGLGEGRRGPKLGEDGEMGDLLYESLWGLIK